MGSRLSAASARQTGCQGILRAYLSAIIALSSSPMMTKGQSTSVDCPFDQVEYYFLRLKNTANKSPAASTATDTASMVIVSERMDVLLTLPMLPP